MVRPRHRSTRPADEPIFTRPDGMDFEKRRLIVPPSFIDLAVLQGGDEYVKASDLAVIVNAILDNLIPALKRIEAHLSQVTGTDYKEEDIK